MDAKKIIAWNLRHYRVLVGLTQERLALDAGVDRAYVGRIERGLENVTIMTLEALAKVINVPIAFLLIEPADGAPTPSPMKAGRKSKSTQSAIRGS